MPQTLLCPTLQRLWCKRGGVISAGLGADAACPSAPAPQVGSCIPVWMPGVQNKQCSPASFGMLHPTTAEGRKFHDAPHLRGLKANFRPRTEKKKKTTPPQQTKQNQRFSFRKASVVKNAGNRGDAGVWAKWSLVWGDSASWKKWFEASKR